jgi:hypothetical protein
MGDLKIISGPAQQRHRTEGQNQAIMAKSLPARTVVHAVARRAEVCPSHIYRWRQEVPV